MFILGEEREDALLGLQLPSSLARLVRGESVHPELDDCCRPLAYCLEPEDFSPSGLNVIPLWEGHSTITGFYFSGGQTIFIIFEVEDIDHFTTLGTTVESVVEDLLAERVDELLDPEDLEELRSLLSM